MQELLKVKVIYNDGDYMHTGFNGTAEEAKEYYIGGRFTFWNGVAEVSKECVKIETIHEEKVYVYGCKVDGEYRCGVTRNTSMNAVIADIKGNYGTEVSNITVSLLDIIDCENTH